MSLTSPTSPPAIEIGLETQRKQHWPAALAVLIWVGVCSSQKWAAAISWIS